MPLLVVFTTDYIKYHYLILVKLFLSKSKNNKNNIVTTAKNKQNLFKRKCTSLNCIKQCKQQQKQLIKLSMTERSFVHRGHPGVSKKKLYQKY